MQDSFLHKTPVKNDQVLFRKEKDSTILLDNRTGQPYVMNETASAVWHVIDGSTKVTDIVSTLKHDFDDTREELEAHVIELIKELVELDFIDLR